MKKEITKLDPQVLGILTELKTFVRNQVESESEVDVLRPEKNERIKTLRKFDFGIADAIYFLKEYEKIQQTSVKDKKEVLQKTKIKNQALHDFLYKSTDSYSTWIIHDGGWRVAMVYIDDEDLWSGYFSHKLGTMIVKEFSYDKKTKTGHVYC